MELFFLITLPVVFRGYMLIKMTKLEEFKEKLFQLGYQLPKSPKFYQNDEIIGVQVGEYWHSCHVESSKIIILLTMSKNKEELVSFWDTFPDKWKEVENG